MGFRLRKTIRIGKFLHVNLSKRGVGFSVGVKGARIGIGPRGRRTTLSVPGTGLSYVKENGWSKSPKLPAQQTVPVTENLKNLPQPAPRSFASFTARQQMLIGVLLSLVIIVYGLLEFVGLLMWIYS